MARSVPKIDCVGLSCCNIIVITIIGVASGVSKLSAHDASFLLSPGLTTEGVPLIVVGKLYPAIAVIATRDAESYV